MKIINGGVCAAKGFMASGVHCGVRKNRTKKDISLIFSETKASAAAVYTTNLVKGAPLTVTKNHIADEAYDAHYGARPVKQIKKRMGTYH